MASSNKKYVADNEKLMAEWNWDKNNELGLNPKKLTCGNDKKAWWICSEGHEWEATVYNRSNGRNCPYCSNKKILIGYNDLATTNPELVKEWNNIKNGDLTPQDVSHGSNKKVWWICDKGHEWEAAISSRSKSHGCPYCAGRKAIVGHNDLATTHPEIAKQWHPTNNGDLTPQDVMSDSHKKVWWICKEGHEWEATVKDRNRSYGCPVCSNRRVLVGYNDLATTNPELAKEWHYTKNGILAPQDVVSGSHEKVWWKCRKGHEWEAVVSSRSNGCGCPYCYQEKQTSFAEQAIYFYCKKVTVAINRYEKFGKGKEIDIYLPEYKVGIEYNGMYWHKNINKKDKDKVGYFAREGIRIITIKEGDKNTVKGDIIEHNHRYKNTLNFVIKSIFDLIDIKYEDVNIDRDMPKIFEQYIEIEKENSVAVKCPKSIIEWNYDKNGDLLPTMVSYSSNKKVWWKCSKCGYEWHGRVADYTRSKHGCSKCAKKSSAIKIGRTVRCIETNIVYESILQAKRETGISNIHSACKGGRKTAGGYHWEFVKKETQ